MSQFPTLVSSTEISGCTNNFSARLLTWLPLLAASQPGKKLHALISLPSMSVRMIRAPTIQEAPRIYCLCLSRYVVFFPSTRPASKHLSVFSLNRTADGSDRLERSREGVRQVGATVEVDLLMEMCRLCLVGTLTFCQGPGGWTTPRCGEREAY